MSASLNALLPQLQPYARALVDAAGAAGLQPRITSTLRSRSEQQRLYNRYVWGQSAFPVALPGTSVHELGAAFDMVVSPMGALADAGALWQSWGGVWGGEIDPVHFELPGYATRSTVVQSGTDGAVDYSSFQRYARYLEFFLPAQVTTEELPPGYAEIARRLGF